MKNASRRRPEVEPLESMVLLSTLIAGPHQTATVIALNTAPLQSSTLGHLQGLVHPAGSTVTITPLSTIARPGATTARVAIVPTRVSATGLGSARVQVSTRIQPGPPIAGPGVGPRVHATVVAGPSPTVHAMIIPSASRAVVVGQVVSPLATPTQASSLAKSESLFAAEHPALGNFPG